MTREDALRNLARVAERRYLELGQISLEDEQYKEARDFCVSLGITFKEITAVGDAVMNKHYIKKGSKHSVPPHLQKIIAPVLAA